LLATKISKNSRKCAVSTPIAPRVHIMENLGLSTIKLKNAALRTSIPGRSQRSTELLYR